MWGGAYRVPPPTLTGSVQSDVVIVDKVIIDDRALLTVAR